MNCISSAVFELFFFIIPISAVSSYFQMESRVHDVEEHFRRSLQQINRDNPPSSRNERRVFEQESHHITVSENSKQQISAAPSPVQTTPTLSPTSVSSQQQGDDSLSRGQTSPMLVNPQQQGAPPPLVLSIPTGSVGTKPEPLKSYNEGIYSN